MRRCHGRKICATLQKNGLLLAVEEKILSYRQFEFVKFAVTSHKNVIGDVRGPKRGERVMIAATKNGNLRASGRLHSGQEEISLLWELLSRFSQPENLVADLSPRTFPTAWACFMVPSPRVSAGCQTDPRCSCVVRAVAARRLAKAAVETESNIALSRESAKAALTLASLVPTVSTPDPLGPPPERLPP